MSGRGFTGAGAPTAATGIGLVILAALLWATVGVAVHLQPEAAGLPPALLGAARMIVAGPFLLLLGLVWRPRARGSRVAAAALARFALANAAFQFCLFQCFVLLGVTVTVFLTVCLPPVIAVLWCCLRRIERVEAGTLLTLVLALLGLGLISAGGAGALGGATAPGLALALAASVAFVVMTYAVRDMARSGPSLATLGAGLSLSGVVLLLSLPLTGAAAVGPVGPGLLALLVWLGIGPTACAYVCYSAGIVRCRSPVVGLVASMIEPVFAALLAILLLGEILTVPTAAGCLALALAMTLLWRVQRQAAAAGP